MSLRSLKLKGHGTSLVLFIFSGEDNKTISNHITTTHHGIMYQTMSAELNGLYPPRLPQNQFSFVSKVVKTIDKSPPIAMLTESEMIVAHRVDISKAQNPTSFLAEYASLLSYGALGSRQFLLLKTLTDTRADKDSPLRLIIPDKNNDNSAVEALLPQLASLKKSINLAPFATLPIWIALDAVTTTISPPFTEITFGTVGTYLLSRIVWMRHVNNIDTKISCGDIEFTAEGNLAPIQESLLCNDRQTALVQLSELGTKPQNDQQGLLYTPETLNLAEMIILSDQHEENISDRALTIVASVASKFGNQGRRTPQN